MIQSAVAHTDAGFLGSHLGFGGEDFVPMPSGALYWPGNDVLLVADLHLEKMSSFAVKGQFLPPYDSYATLKRIAHDLQQTGAEHVISLGDSFHRDEGSGTLPPPAREILDDLLKRVAWTWIAGNHDPGGHDLGGVCVQELTLDGILLTHEPRRTEKPTIAGHLHPAARIAINGRSTRRPCFAADRHLLLMPAYGASTGSLNILSAPFSGLFEFSELQVHMLGSSAIFPVNTRRLVGG